MGKGLKFFAQWCEDPKKSVRQMLFQSICIAGSLGGIVTEVILYLRGVPKFQLLLMGICILVLAGCFVLSKIKNNYEFASVLMILLMTWICIPLIFFASGGVYGGSVLWLEMGMVCNFLLLDGISFYCMLTGEFILYSLCFFVSYYHKEWVIPLTSELQVYIEVWQNVFVAALIMGVLIKLQIALYKNQIHLNEQQNEQLLAMSKKALEEGQKAKEANEVKNRFLANMSHEIRTPINSVLGMNEMILRECDDPKILEYARNIQHSNQALLYIINDLLDWSKIEAGKMEIVPADYDTEKMLANICNIIKIRIQNKGLEFIEEIDPNIPSILHGDDVRIQQVLMNLLTNAVKYTQVGQVIFRVSVTIEEENMAKLHFEVSDTGIGIKESDQERIFEAFERIEEKNNRNIEGNGLGMAIIHQLLELMDARLEMKSVYGEGSTFSFDLMQPIVNAQPIGEHLQSTDTVKEYQVSFVAPEAKILVVDDNELNRVVFKALLEQTNMQIDEAASGEEGLKLISQNAYDMIFLDHMMPGMDGMETFRRMKQEPLSFNMDTPVIMLTANAFAKSREMYLEAGFDAFLPKPIDSEQLESLIRKSLPGELVHKM